jgi:hypothetical protein
MLDPERLRAAFVLRQKNGKQEPDEAAALNTLASTLRAVAALHAKRPAAVTPELRAAVEKLGGHANAAIRAEAEKTRLALTK